MQGQAYALVRDQQTALNLAANFGSGVNGADSSVLLDPQAAGMGVCLHPALHCGWLLCILHPDCSSLVIHATPCVGRTMPLLSPLEGLP